MKQMTRALPDNIADLLSRYGETMYKAGREVVSCSIRLRLGVSVADDNNNPAADVLIDEQKKLREELVDAIREALG